MRTLPPIGFLLDVGGPSSSPETRRVPHGIMAALVALGDRGIPVVFNTGRSADFVLHQVVGPVREAGLTAGAGFHAVCEKGGVHFSFKDVPDGAVPRATLGQGVPEWVAVDAGMRLPKDLESHLARLVREHTDTISSDVEHASSGKDLGASRAWGLVATDGELPVQWFTCGDSKTDYAMADWLHAHGARVSHMDVRHEDGIPETPYPVLTSEDLAPRGFGPADGRHEVAGQALLEWALDTMGSSNATL